MEDTIARLRDIKSASSAVTMPTSKLDPRGEYEPLYIDSCMIDEWNDLPLIDHGVFWKKCLKKGMESTQRSMRASPEEDAMRCHEKFKKFAKEVSSLGKKDDVGTVIHLPIAQVQKTLVYNEFWPDMLGDCLNEMDASVYGRLWTAALVKAMNSPDRYAEVPYDEMLKYAYEVVPAKDAVVNKAERSGHFTVDLGFEHDIRVEIAKRGVRAKDKDMAEHPEVKDHYKASKESYLYETDCQDISDSFEQAWKLFMKSEDTYPSVEDRVKKLVIRALKLCGDGSSEADFYYRTLQQKTMFHMFDFLDSVVSEVNLSRLKFVKDDYYIVKKLPNYNAFLIIRTTGGDNHLFVSVFVPDHAMGRERFPLSERWMWLGGGYCTKFISLNRDSITHHLYTTQKMTTLFFFWMHQFMILPSINKICCGQEDAEMRSAFEHFWISCLVHLEDKEKTSSALQLVRYSYMEVVKGGPTFPDPGKIIKKLDPIVRSRLLLWCLKRWSEVFPLMVLRPPQMSKLEASDRAELSDDDKQSGLLSWVTGDQVPRFEIVLNLSYLGVLHNKEEGNVLHGFLKVFEKIIQQEMQLPAARIENMTVGKEFDPEKLKDHEFSAVAVKSFCSYMRCKLQSKFGNYNEWATKMITEALSKRSILDLCTSKSSATPDYSNYEGDEGDKEQIAAYLAKRRKDKAKTRVKAIENMYDVVKRMGLNSSDIFSNIAELISELEKQGGIISSMFKKMQIGGTREIFILEIKSRVCVNFVETIARALCEHIPCEMLTKGNQKMSRSDAHFSAKRKHFEDFGTTTVISSDDAATWAQRFVMPVFGVMFNELLPREFVAPCMRVLNLMTSKRLLLPDLLLDKFCQRPEVLSTLVEMNLLKTEYLTKTPTRLLLDHSGSRMMRNRSNMAQGILHYTSSLLHACYMTSFCGFFTNVLKSGTLPGVKGGLLTGKVSSDDSSLLVTLASEKGKLSKERETMELFGSFICMAKSHGYPLICARQSYEKSTPANCQMIEEFNSIWHYRNTLITPGIKFVAQSARTHVTDRFETRLEVMAGLRNQVYENSGSTLLCAIIQSAQARCHYLSLGAESHKLFPELEKSLLLNPHPSLGFFLFDHHLVAGILGLNFSLYTSLRNDPKLRSLSKSLACSSSLTMLKEDLGLCKLSLTHGSDERYKEMLARMNVDYETVLKYFDQNPDILCRFPQSAEELQQLIALKAATPSMANSFEFLTDSKLHAASAYALHTPCVTVVERMITIGDYGVESVMFMKKKSLLKAIRDLSTSATEGVSMGDLEWLFPHSTQYNLLLDSIIPEMEERSVPAICHPKRRIYYTAILPKFDVSFMADPFLVCANKWFNHPYNRTEYEMWQTWTSLQSKVNWLHGDYKTTLMSSPHGSAVALIAYVKQFRTTTSSIRAIVPMYRVNTLSLDDVFKNLVKRSYYPGHILISHEKRLSLSEWDQEEDVPREEEAHSRKRAALAKDIMGALWNVHSSVLGPLNTHSAGAILERMPAIVSLKESGTVSPWIHLRPDHAKLALIQLVANNPAVNVANILHHAKKGLRGCFTTRAKYSSKLNKYVGPARYVGYFNNTPFSIDMEGERLTMLTLREKSYVKTFCLGVEGLMREIRCYPSARKERGAEFYLVFKQKYLSLAPGTDRIPIRFDKELTIPNLGNTASLEITENGTMRLIQTMSIDKDLMKPVKSKGKAPVSGSWRDAPKLKLPDDTRANTILSLMPKPDREAYKGNVLKITKERPLAYYWSIVEPLPLKLAKEELKFFVPMSRKEKDWKASISPADQIFIESEDGAHVLKYMQTTLKERAVYKHVISRLSSDLNALLPVKSSSSLDLPEPHELYENQLDPVDEEDDEDMEDLFAQFYDESEELGLHAEHLMEGVEEEMEVIDFAEEDAPGADPAEQFLGAHETTDVAMENADIFEYRPSHQENMMHTYLSSAYFPLWDELLDDLKKNTTPEVRRLCFDGKVEPGFAPTAKLISYVYGARPESAEEEEEDPITRVITDYKLLSTIPLPTGPPPERSIEEYPPLPKTSRAASSGPFIERSPGGQRRERDEERRRRQEKTMREERDEEEVTRSKHLERIRAIEAELKREREIFQEQEEERRRKFAEEPKRTPEEMGFAPFAKNLDWAAEETDSENDEEDAEEGAIGGV